MLSYIVDGVDVFNPIEGKLDRLIEYFVDFYGEANREKITSRLKNTTYFFTGEIGATVEHTTLNDLEEYFNKKKAVVAENLFKELGVESLENVSYFRLSKEPFVELAKVVKDFKNNDTEKYVKKEEKLLNLFVFLNFCNLLDENGEFGEYIEKGVKTFNDKETYTKIANLIIKANNLWNEKYKKEYLNIAREENKAKKFFEDLEENAKKIADHYNDLIIDLITNYFINVKNFTEEELNKLDEDKLLEYVDTFCDILEKNEKFITNYDINKRIKLFKFLGFDHGNDYNEYLKDEKLKEILNDGKITEPYYRLIDNAFSEHSMFNIFYNDVIDRLNKDGIDEDEKNLYIPIYRYVMELSNDAAWAYLFNKVKTDKIRYICACTNYFSLSTQVLIHEQNHIVSWGKFFKDKKIVNEKLGAMGKLLIDSPRLLLNEVITDYFALKIYEKCKKDNFEVGAIGYKPSGYSKMFMLLKGFIEENMQTLKECFISDEPNMIIEKFGKNNVKLLTTALNNFNKLEWEEVDEAIKEIKKRKDLTTPLSQNAEIVLNAFNNVRKVRQNLKQNNAIKTEDKKSKNSTQIVEELLK